MKHSGFRSIATNAGHLSVARLFSPAVRVIYVVLLARYLGAETYGLLAYAQSWYLAFLPLPLLGLSQILSREIGQRSENGRDLVAQVMALRIAASVLTAALCAALGWLVERDHSLRVLLLLFSLVSVGRALAMTAEAIFVAYERSQYALLQEAVFRPLEVVAGIAILVLGGGALEITVLHVCVWWLQAFRGLSLVGSRIVPVTPHWNVAAAGRLLSSGLPVGLGTVLANWHLMGPVVLYRLAGATPGDLGAFAIAWQTLTVATLVPTAIATAALPVLSRAVERSDGKDTLFVSVLTRAAIVVGGLAGLVGMAWGATLVVSVFGSDYAAAGALLGPVLWLAVPATIATAAGQVLLARRSYTAYLLCAAAGAVTLTVSLFPLAALAGSRGAILATAIGLGVFATALLAVVRSYGNLSLAQSLLKPGAVAALAAALYFNVAPGGIWLALAVSVAVLVGGSWLVGVISPAERVVIRTLLRRSGI